MTFKKRVLVVSPHPDDETLGAGGTIAKYIEQGSEVFILTVSGHMPPLYSNDEYERTLSEAGAAFDILGVSEYEFLSIPSTMIGDKPIHELNNMILKVVDNFNPHVVL